MEIYIRWSIDDVKRCQKKFILRNIYRRLIRQISQNNQQNVIQQKHTEGLDKVLVQLCQTCTDGNHVTAPHKTSSHIDFCKRRRKKELMKTFLSIPEMFRQLMILFNFDATKKFHFYLMGNRNIFHFIYIILVMWLEMVFAISWDVSRAFIQME